MSEIKFLKEPKARKESDWFLVGKVWPHKTKKDAYSGRFGVKSKDAAGSLTNTFDEITVKPDDPIMIRPNTNQREGKKDPQFLLYMLKTASK